MMVCANTAWRLMPACLLPVPFVRAALVALGALAAPVALDAPAANASPSAKAVGDWFVTCADGAGATCQMLQAVRASDGIPALLVTISRLQGGDRLAVVTAPLKSYLVPGIEIRVDRRRPFKALYELCDPTGCHAGFKIDGAVSAALQKGSTAWVRVWTAKEKAADFPISLKGFSVALAELEAAGGTNAKRPRP